MIGAHLRSGAGKPTLPLESSTTGGALMASLFGNKQSFAAEVGEFWKGHQDLRRVDIWAAGRWWTREDNTAYVPQFCASVQDSVNWLRSGCDLTQPFPEVAPAEAHRRLLSLDDGLRERFWFPMWGPTTDNVTAHLFRAGTRVVIPFELWQRSPEQSEEAGRVFVAELPEVQFVGVLEQMVAALKSSTNSEPGYPHAW